MSLDDVELTLVDSMEDVGRMLTWLGERRPMHALGIDTETSGFSVRTDRLRLVQVGDHNHGWAFSWEDWGGLLRDLVKRWDGRWILHNAPFDLKFMRKYGVELPRHMIDDTMVMARIAEPHTSMALKSQASRHIDSAASGLQADLADTKWTWETVPIDYQPYWAYGALDPVLTYRLYMHHWPVVSAEAPRAYDLEMAVLWVTERMERYGTHVDREYASSKLKEFLAYCAQVDDWCQTEYDVKPGSNQRIIEILQSDGVEFTKQTKSGAISLDKEVLAEINHPLARAVLQRRQVLKMATTYLEHYVTEADENDLLHPSINTLGARTSRMSISNPAMQTLPRPGTSRPGDVVRNCITTRYDDGSLVMCDFDQIEARMLAHAAGEQAMIDAFKSPDDFFTTLARQIFDDPTIVKKDPRRQITKNATYAILYGAKPRKFAQTAGISESAAYAFFRRWDALYPAVKAFQDNTVLEAVERKAEFGEIFTRSFLTGRRYVADSSGKAYTLVNYQIQGGAAELMKYKLVQLDAAGLGEFMCLPVHDEVILDVPREDIADVAATLHDVMNDDKLLSVPITAGISWGKRWGEKVDYELVGA